MMALALVIQRSFIAKTRAHENGLAENSGANVLRGSRRALANMLACSSVLLEPVSTPS